MRSETSSKTKKVNINRIFVIIPAAGLGTRMESDINKQLMEIDGESVIERTLDAFKKFSDNLSNAGITIRAVIVTGEELIYKINSVVKHGRYDFVQNVVVGGQTRMESVWNGIEALAELPFPPMDNDIVFIHDGARCLVDQETLERCLEGGIQYDICAAAVPVKSTIKQTKPDDSEVSDPLPVNSSAEETKEAEVSKTRPVSEVKTAAEPEKPKSALGIDLSKFQTLGAFSIRDKALASLRGTELKAEAVKADPEVKVEPEAKPKAEEAKAEPKNEPVSGGRPGGRPAMFADNRKQREIRAIRNSDDDSFGMPLASGGVPIFKAAPPPQVEDEPDPVEDIPSEEVDDIPASAISRRVTSPVRRPAVRPKTNLKPAPEVIKTPNRKELMEVQTPQVFKFDKLVESYVNGIRKNIEATDDTSLAEALNFKVHLVEGSYSNIKITTKEDIDYAEMLLKRQARPQD